jgi:hypothetical protein
MGLHRSIAEKNGGITVLFRGSQSDNGTRPGEDDRNGYGLSF